MEFVCFDKDYKKSKTNHDYKMLKASSLIGENNKKSSHHHFSALY